MTNLIDMALLEHCVREDLNEQAPRVMGVLRPLRVVIDNYPEGQVEEFEFANHPQNPDMGTRMVPLLTGSSTSNVTTFMKTRRASTNVSLRGARCDSEMPMS